MSGTELAAGRISVIMKRVLATMVVAIVLVFLVDLLAGPVFFVSTQAWPPARQGDKVIGGIQGLVKATDPPASSVRISSGFLGVGSLTVVVTPETAIAVDDKLGGFADLSPGQRVRVSYEVHPDRLVAARVELLKRSSDASEAPVPGEQRSAAMVPSLAPPVVPWTAVVPDAITSSSPHVVSPVPVPERGVAPASPPKRSAPAPTSASSRAAQPPRPAKPPPVTSVRRTRPPAASGAPQNAQDARRPAHRKPTARAPQTSDVLRSARPPAVSPGNGASPTNPPTVTGGGHAQDAGRRPLPSPAGSAATSDPGLLPRQPPAGTPPDAGRPTRLPPTERPARPEARMPPTRPPAARPAAPAQGPTAKPAALVIGSA